MNVLGCAVSFGLGPSGKLSSIISKSLEINNDIKWYGSGDELDLDIFEENVFNDICWTKDTNEIKKFVKKNNIELAIDVLDPEIAIILKKIGINVFYIDSLPFMWTEADLIPFNVDIYFAQKCVNMNNRAQKILMNVNNLKWINPIIPDIKFNDSNVKKYNVVVNLGGMHSPYGDGEEYIKLVVVNLLNELLKIYKSDQILVTCGSKANKSVKNILNQNNVKGIKVKTLKQIEFLEYVKNCDLFITSPGMTTIYETCGLDKNTIILPPQNLSQFYNKEFAKKLIKKLKVIEWNKDDLEFEYIKNFIELGEEKVVEIIYQNIKSALNDENYNLKIKFIIRETLKMNFEGQNIITYNENGTNEIVNKILEKI